MGLDGGYVGDTLHVRGVTQAAGSKLLASVPDRRRPAPIAELGEQCVL